MEIITGIERRRNWPLEQKLAVLAEASRGSESAARSPDGMTSARSSSTAGGGSCARDGWTGASRSRRRFCR